MAKIKNKKKKIIIGIVVIGLLIFAYTRYKASTNNIEDLMASTEIEYVVEKGNIKKSITGSGSVDSSDSRTILSEIEGSIDEIYVEEGQKVSEDEILALYEVESDNEEILNIETQRYNLRKNQSELEQLVANKKDLRVYAENSGNVKLFVEEGDEISKNAKIAELTEKNVIYFETYFNENQIENISENDKAKVFINSMLISLEGKITDINKTPVSTGASAIGYLVKGKIDYNGMLEEGENLRITVVNNQGEITSNYTGQVIKTIPKDIYSPYEATVKDIHIEEGDYVENNQEIMTLESEELEFDIEQKRLNLEKNRLDLNNLMEEDSTIISPIEGTILTVVVDEQGYVDKGNELFKISDLENMEVVIEVDELDILSISKGQDVTIESEVFEEEILQGKVSSISLKGNNQGGITTYDVTISLDDRKNLMSGMNVDVEILISKKNDALLVPIQALSKVANEYIVQIKDEENNLSPKTVEIGITNENFAEIKSGLEEGEKIYYKKSFSQDFPGGMIFQGPGSGPGSEQGRSGRIGQ